MKPAFTLLLLLSAILTQKNFAQKTSDSVAGTWQLIFSRGNINGNVFHKDSSGIIMIKVLTASMFFNTVYDKNEKRFMSAVQGLYVAANGSYSETVVLSSVGGFSGHTFSYHYQIENDLLTISGESNGIKLLEKWKRIE